MVKCLTSPHVPGHHQSHMGHMTVTWRSHDGHMGTCIGLSPDSGPVALDLSPSRWYLWDSLLWSRSTLKGNSRNGPDQIQMALADFSSAPVKHDYHKPPHTAYPLHGAFFALAMVDLQDKETSLDPRVFCSFLFYVEQCWSVAYCGDHHSVPVSSCVCRLHLQNGAPAAGTHAEPAHGPRGPSWSQEVMAHLQRDRQAALCQPATGHSHRCHRCHSTRSDLSQTLRLITSKNSCKTLHLGARQIPQPQFSVIQTSDVHICHKRIYTWSFNVTKSW